MRVGDLIQHYDADCGTGIIIAMDLEWPDVEILWSDGLIEACDSQTLEVVIESR